MEQGFFHPERGYWQTISEPSSEMLASYPAGTVQVPLKPGADFEWDGVAWIATIPAPVVLTSAEQTSAIEAQRDAALAAGVDHNGIRWHTDITFLSELTTIILGYTIGVRSGTTAIRTKQNTIEHLELPALVALAGAVGNHRAAAFALSWAAKDALNAS